MKKYNIEGDIDFFNELFKSLDNNESIEKNENDCIAEYNAVLSIH